MSTPESSCSCCIQKELHKYVQIEVWALISSKYKQETVSLSHFLKQGGDVHIHSQNSPSGCKHESLLGLTRELKDPLRATYYSKSTVKGNSFLQLLDWAIGLFSSRTCLMQGTTHTDESKPGLPIYMWYMLNPIQRIQYMTLNCVSSSLAPLERHLILPNPSSQSSLITSCRALSSVPV